MSSISLAHDSRSCTRDGIRRLICWLSSSGSSLFDHQALSPQAAKLMHTAAMPNDFNKKREDNGLFMARKAPA